MSLDGVRTEREFTRWVLKQARARGWLAAHLGSYDVVRTRDGQRLPIPAKDARGFPDLVLVRDRVVYAELKLAKAKPKPEQIVWIERLRAAGAEVHVWRPEDADEIFDVLDGKPTGSRLFPVAGGGAA